MIKQIQLRGISRTPSDRLSEDGGLSESLNMYLDTAEQAPAFVPKDVTGELGIPANADCYYAFIHKGSGYETILYANDIEIGYYKDGEPIHIVGIEEGDVITDMSSIGNSVIVKGNITTYYLLYKEGEYLSLGPQVPFPIMEIKSVSTGYTNEILNHQEVSTSWNITAFDSFDEFNNSQEEDKKNIRSTLSEQIRKTYKARTSQYLKEGNFTTMRFIRYAIQLFDGTLISSIPFMVGSFPEILSEKVVYPADYEGEHGSRQTNTLRADKYKINVKLPNINVFKGWEHIVAKVNIYLSPPIIPDQDEQLIKAYAYTQYQNQIPEGLITTTRMSFDTGSLFLDKEEIIFYAAQCKLIKEIKIFEEDTFRKEVHTQEYKDLCKGIEITGAEDYDYTQLVVKESIKDDDIQHYPTLGERYSSYNNRLLAISPVQTISYMYSTLPDANSFGQSNGCLLQFILLTDSGEKIVEKKVPFGRKYFFFPDIRCHRVNVFFEKGGKVLKLSYEMKTFAFMEGSYYLDDNFLFDGDTSLSSDTYKAIEEQPKQIQIYDAKSNYLYMSKSDDLFVFPDETKYQFQSKIIGIGLATSALSQGQFGQFPLYVFTEDGIWVMETAADGSFISQKPLSREVCINPDSICSIDNAVVFVTNKAVMMIQGSQAINISPYMNGRHYTPNDSALNLIRNQEGFDTLIEPISDDDPFMSFMKDAKVAYDYTGQRLVFISPSNKGFQYVYKIDTQTWHKTSFDSLTLDTPLNSYPESLVLSNLTTKADGIYIIADPLDSFTEQDAFDIVTGFDDFETEPSILDATIFYQFITGKISTVRVCNLEETQDIINAINNSVYKGEEGCRVDNNKSMTTSRIFSLSTILDAKPNPENPQKVAKGILITRPFDLGMPDVYKSITSIKIRGDYDKGNVKYILQGSDDGRTFYTLSSMRGKSWKMFRLFILADLEPTERISWVDIEYETRFKNRLR